MPARPVGPFGVADQQLAALQGVILAVQGAQDFARLRPADDDVAAAHLA